MGELLEWEKSFRAVSVHRGCVVSRHAYEVGLALLPAQRHTSPRPHVDGNPPRSVLGGHHSHIRSSVEPLPLALVGEGPRLAGI